MSMNIPSLNGNWIDLLIVIFIVLYAADKWKKGLLEGGLDLGGFLLSLVIALRFYPFASKLLQSNFSLSRGISQALGFLITSFIAEFILSLLIIYFTKFIPQKIIQSSYNRKLGLIPALFSSLILSAFFLTALLTLPVRPDIKKSIMDSKIGGYLTKNTLGAEKSISDIFGGAVADTLSFLTVKPQGNESINLNFKTSETEIDMSSEETMLQLVNRERTKNNLKILTSDSLLRTVARNHCRDMFQKGYFSHNSLDGRSPFDRMQNEGVSYKTAGENLAFAPTVDIAHTGLMNSPGHRANILSSDYGKVGIGVIDGGVYGKMFCQEFTD